MLQSPSVKELVFCIVLFWILGKGFEEGKKEMGMRMFVSMSEPLCPELSPWLLQDKGRQFCLQLQRYREQRGDFHFFFKLAPVRVCEQLLL